MLKQLDVPPGEAAMVGDHPMDIRAGKEAGLRTIGVLTGYSQAEALHRAGADLPEEPSGISLETQEDENDGGPGF